MSDSTKVLQRKGEQNPMESSVWIIGVILFYFALQLWILPKLGIST